MNKLLSIPSPFRTDPLLDRLLFLIILLIAAYLRFEPLGAVSLGNDELSALQRLKFASFSEMLEKGVYPDFHPALVQSFLYVYTGWVGTSSEFLLRLPFAIASLLGLVFLYRLARSHGSATSALLITGFVAAAAFPVLYARLARPYAFGFLFILMFAFYQDRFLQAEDRRQEVRWMPALAISGALCVYTHYFCGLTAILLAALGFFRLRKDALRNYLLSGLGSLLIFSPHLGITFHHLSKGGVGGAEGWLGEPDLSFFSEHFLHIFNDSPGMLALWLLVPAISLVVYSKKADSAQWTFLAVFLLPLLLGYGYSIWVNPVLQDSVLLFSMPFLPLFLFSRVPEISNSWMKTGLVLFLALGMGIHTVSAVWYYKTPTQGNFEQIADIYADWHEKYGASRIERAASMTSAAYLDHYLKDRKVSAPELSNISYEKDLQAFIQRVEDSQTPYFVYAWATSANRVFYRELIRESYPQAVERHRFFNSGITLYSRQGKDERKRLWEKDLNFDNPSSLSEEKREHLSKEHARSPSYSYKMSGEEKYGPVIEQPLEKAANRKGSMLVKGSAWIKSEEPIEEVRMVVSHDVQDSTYMWRSSPKELTERWKGNEWKKIFVVGVIWNEMPRDGQLNCYVWKKGKKSIHLDDIKVEIMPWWDMNDEEEYLHYLRVQDR